MPTYMGLSGAETGYLVVIFILSGLWLTLVDVAAYRRKGMKRVVKHAEAIGTTYVLAGICLWLAAWAYTKWFW